MKREKILFLTSYRTGEKFRLLSSKPKEWNPLLQWMLHGSYRDEKPTTQIYGNCIGMLKVKEEFFKWFGDLVLSVRSESNAKRQVMCKSRKHCSFLNSKNQCGNGWSCTQIHYLQSLKTFWIVMSKSYSVRQISRRLKQLSVFEI